MSILIKKGLTALRMGGGMSRYVAYAVAGVFSALPPFFLMRTLTGSLSTSEFATTTLVWSALTLLTPIIGLGAVNSASVRYFKLSGKEFANHLRSIFILIAISSTILLLLGLFINYGVYKFFPVEASAFVLIIMIATMLSFGQLFASLAVVSSRPFAYLKFYFFYGSISVFSVYAFVEYFGLQMTGFYAGLFLGAAALTASSYFTYKNIIRDGRANYKECRSALLFGMPLMFHSVALNLSSTSDRFIIADTIGLSQLAIYSATAQVALLANFAAHAVIKGVQPRLFALLLNFRVTNWESLRNLSLLYLGVTLLMSLSVGFLTPGIVNLIAGPDFVADWQTTLLLVIGGLFGSWYLFFSLFLHFYENTRRLSAVTVLTATVQIALCTILTRELGLFGASLAYVSSNGMLLILTAFLAFLAVKNYINYNSTI